MTDRSAYIDKMKAKVDEWTADIEKMQAKAKGAQADARIEFDKQLAEMRKQRDEAQVKIKEAQEASDGAWDDMRKGFEFSLGQYVEIVPERDEALYLIRFRGGESAAADTPSCRVLSLHRGGDIEIGGAPTFIRSSCPVSRPAARGRAPARPG